MNRIFSESIAYDGIYFKHARGISERSGKEFHLNHEIIYFLEGDAEFISERLRMVLVPKTLVFIPKETYHQMVLHGNQEQYYRCILNFPDMPDLLDAAGQLEKIKAVMADEEMEYFFQKLIHAQDLPETEAAPVLKAVVTLLLNAMHNKAEATEKENSQSKIIRLATQYIDENMGNRFFTSDIAAACNVSVSTLSHSFKREMNISLHQFVLRKRLMAAYHRIAAGQPATTAAMECGFHDYSGFYKQYKRMFGFPPSHKHT